MTTADLFTNLTARGLRFSTPDGVVLRVGPGDKLTPEDRSEIALHKPGLLALLASMEPSVFQDDRIKAIETRYKGYRFRSRLEARWAVFLDSLGVKWEYEPEGFDLESGRYLPDFFLPFPEAVSWSGWRSTQAYWLEIKPSEPDERERALMLELARRSKHHVICFSGAPDPEQVTVYSASIQGRWHNSTETRLRQEADRNDLARLHGFAEQRIDRRLATIFSLYSFESNLGSNRNLAGAFTAALSARFEHGECG